MTRRSLRLCRLAAGAVLPLSWIVGLAPAVQAGLLDSLKGVLSEPSGGPSSPSPALSRQEISQGLLEALRVGAEKAVHRASAPGAFLDNPAIHISLPRSLQSAGSALRALGMGQTVDEFERTLNRAAERASGKALPIFADAIGALTFQDAERIWKGGESAATDYLRSKTTDQLTAAFEPVVHSAAQEVGVTRAYEAMTSAAPLRSLLKTSDVDLDSYVTRKTLSGLFSLLAEEEKQIRTNPAARTTDLLKRLFSR